jgi:hypothetical protein
MVEPRATESGVEEIVAEGILAREPPYRHIGHVVVAHGEATVVPASVIPGDELVHAAAVDLILLLIEEVHRVAGELGGRDIAREVEGSDGEVRRVARVWLPVKERLGEGPVGRAVLADLLDGAPSMGDPVRARKEPELSVEALVLHVDYDHVLGLFDPLWDGYVTACTATHKNEDQQGDEGELDIGEGDLTARDSSIAWFHRSSPRSLTCPDIES